MNDILQANTVITPAPDSNVEAIDDAPLKIKAVEKMRTGDDFIQDFFEEDVIEYIKPKNRQ